MNNIRLKIIAANFSESLIYDIGSDHGLLPKYLLENKKIVKAYIIEINEKPLKNAKKTLQDYQNCEYILSDGLLKIDSISYNSGIVVAGMGGKLIISIIKNSIKKIRNAQSIYLQPNNSEYKLRDFLIKNNFKIIKEEIIIENNIINFILKVKPNCEQKLTEMQLLFGLNKTSLSVKKYKLELAKLKEIYVNIPHEHENKEKIDIKIKKIELFLKGES